MTEADVIAHWQNGARSELQAAKILRNGRQYTIIVATGRSPVECLPGTLGTGPKLSGHRLRLGEVDGRGRRLRQ